jgi:4-alpha-glucanotransferase
LSDDQLRKLALAAGVDDRWIDQVGEHKTVSPETLRAVIAAIGHACRTDRDIADSLRSLETGEENHAMGAFLTARVDEAVSLPFAARGKTLEIKHDDGSRRSVKALQKGKTTDIPSFEEPGYYTIESASKAITLAIAPRRAMTVDDLTNGQTVWGVAAQIYSLRRQGDAGVGDFGAAAALGRAAGKRGADLLALSPVHALFPAQPGKSSPYSPSTRLFFNPVHADPHAALPAQFVGEVIASAGLSHEIARLDALGSVDWQQAGAMRLSILRHLYDAMMVEAVSGADFRQDFEAWRAKATPLLLDHAAFDALQADQIHQGASSSWRYWPKTLANPAATGVKRFVSKRKKDVDFQMFCQWLTSRSFSRCQQDCRAAGMRIGLIADLAVGMDPDGSHAWSRQDEILKGLSIGAPPDYYNAEGQSWGLSGFSPRGLINSGFSPFIETLRASLGHAGGLRIDHVMGLHRLWLVPDGAKPTEGAYLNYPSEDLFRLIALESWRHKAVVIGEDLGTLPTGFREYLQDQGVAGLRVLRFEKDQQGAYLRPETWDPKAAALSTTHDLVPTAGWWAGSDLPSQADDTPWDQTPDAIRAWDRGILWSALEHEGLVAGPRPEPDDTDPVVDGVIQFVARTPCALKIVAMEDILGVRVQPNVPGTTVEEPNWQHRLDGQADQLLDSEAAMRRIRILGGHDPQPDPAV